ncbi:hypothetical protein AQI95_21210 [Streptomyces yokosukanensis]|uniref:DNA primase/polymerase bifunctional N-terminal domain-containing protein n=1 Tax=Streptomyces yokosukanensis TaxID=67386 RepID=A0A101P2Y7_9ACTN|nr:hypothetical protein [Streptomyces yokosukanensis]KUN03961.1 hypothetical protein AQI95_21210 [Streptomyces yokosukanensis]
MAHPLRSAAQYEAGDKWLAECSEHPAVVRAAWDQEILAPIASGAHWLVAESSLMRGWPAASRIRESPHGPVLADPDGNRMFWLVAPSAAEELADVRQLVVHPAGWLLPSPPTGWQVEGRFWLWRPDGTGQLNDPALIAAAFGPGGYRTEAEARA